MASEPGPYVFADKECPLHYLVTLTKKTWNYHILHDHDDELLHREGDVELSILEPERIYQNSQKGRVNFVYWKSFPFRPAYQRVLKVSTWLKVPPREAIVTTAVNKPEIIRLYVQSGERQVWP